MTHRSPIDGPHGRPIATAISTGSSDRFGPFEVTDLSSRGALFSGPLPRAASGTRVRLFLSIPNRRRPLELMGRLFFFSDADFHRRCGAVFDHETKFAEEMLAAAIVIHGERSVPCPYVAVLEGGDLDRRSLHRALEERGYETLFADTLVDAVLLLEASPERCRHVILDAAFLARVGDRATGVLAECFPRHRRILAVREYADPPAGPFGAIDAIIGMPWRKETLAAALDASQPWEVRPRILFVDDEPQVLAGLQSRLRKDLRPWDATWVTSGAEALREFRTSPFDVVVTDVQMPGMDGISLLRAIKVAAPAVRGVVLSGHAAPEGAEIADVFLRKPCSVSALRESVFVDRAT